MDQAMEKWLEFCQDMPLDAELSLQKFIPRYWRLIMIFEIHWAPHINRAGKMQGILFIFPDPAIAAIFREGRKFAWIQVGAPEENQTEMTSGSAQPCFILRTHSSY